MPGWGGRQVATQTGRRRRVRDASQVLLQMAHRQEKSPSRRSNSALSHFRAPTIATIERLPRHSSMTKTEPRQSIHHESSIINHLSSARIEFGMVSPDPHWVTVHRRGAACPEPSGRAQREAKTMVSAVVSSRNGPFSAFFPKHRDEDMNCYPTGNATGCP